MLHQLKSIDATLRNSTTVITLSKVHEGGKEGSGDFLCSTCNVGFSSAHNLTRHNTIVHGVKKIKKEPLRRYNKKNRKKPIPIKEEIKQEQDQSELLPLPLEVKKELMDPDYDQEQYNYNENYDQGYV